jgi:hypothetical protein
MEALNSLRGAGMRVEQLTRPSPALPDQPDAVINVLAGGTSTQFAIEERQRAPYPNELARLDARRWLSARHGEPLLIVPYVSETLGDALSSAGWSWADAQGNFDLRGPGVFLSQRRTAKDQKAAAKTIPQGSGSLAIIRSLIRQEIEENEEPSATTLAARANVTQPRASQVLGRLADLDLVEKTSRGRWRPDREALLDRFLAEYRGPRGSERYFYGLDTPMEIAIRASNVGRSLPPIAVSADVGPDLLVAWRRPSVVVLYIQGDFLSNEIGLVTAQGRHDANVIVRSPDDRSVFPVPALVARLDGAQVNLADPTQMIWDLQDLGGADRLEAAGVLREWLLTRP